MQRKASDTALVRFLRVFKAAYPAPGIGSPGSPAPDHSQTDSSAQISTVGAFAGSGTAAAELAAQIAKLETAHGQIRETTPSVGLHGRKGLLIMPVKGKISARFGPFTDPRYNLPRSSNGIRIAAMQGMPIRAVAAGQVRYAGWFQSFGNVAIIDHGDNYYTVYAHMEEVFKFPGDVVEKSEVIATVGVSGSVAEPTLYFEIRHHGQPLDPIPWFQGG